MNKIIAIIFIFLSFPTFAQHSNAFGAANDQAYKSEKALVKKVLKRRLSVEKSIFFVDSLLSSKTLTNSGVISELYALKARLLLELNKERLDSLIFKSDDDGVRRKQGDTTGNYVFQPILEQWEIACSTFPNPFNRVERYESILREYGVDENLENNELDSLKKMGYKSQFSSLFFSAGLRANDKNLVIYFETSLLKGKVQPHYLLKTPNGKKFSYSRYTENLILTAEVNNSWQTGFSVSPARINSFIVVEPIRIGIKKSWESDSWRMFLRPSLGISYGYLSAMYSTTIYLRKSESRSSDIHYLQLRFSFPLNKNKVE